jgi:two-component system response regulator GlrR
MTAARRRVLIIDNESDVLEVLREVVADLGYEVNTARDWTQARAFVPVFRPDVILLDLTMPTMSRDRALDVIHRDHPYVPVVIMAVDLTMPQDVSAGGAVGCISKPFDLDVVERALASVIATSRA